MLAVLGAVIAEPAPAPVSAFASESGSGGFPCIILYYIRVPSLLLPNADCRDPSSATAEPTSAAYRDASSDIIEHRVALPCMRTSTDGGGRGSLAGVTKPGACMLLLLMHLMCVAALLLHPSSPAPPANSCTHTRKFVHSYRPAVLDSKKLNGSSFPIVPSLLVIGLLYVQGAWAKVPLTTLNVLWVPANFISPKVLES